MKLKNAMLLASIILSNGQPMMSPERVLDVKRTTEADLEAIERARIKRERKAKTRAYLKHQQL